MEENWRKGLVKGMEYRHHLIGSLLLICMLVMAACHSLHVSTRNTDEDSIMSGKYYYAHWVISKQQTVPHLVVSDSIGDYKEMEDQYEYFVGQNDDKGRLIYSERWIRDRTDVPFPLPDIQLDVNQRRYFKVVEHDRLQEIGYSETEGKSEYILVYKYVSNLEWEKGTITIRRQFVRQHMISIEEYIYEGDERTASEVIKHAVSSPESPR